MANRNSEVPSSEGERGRYISIITPKGVYLHHTIKDKGKIVLLVRNIAQQCIISRQDQETCVAECEKTLLKPQTITAGMFAVCQNFPKFCPISILLKSI